MADNTQIIVKFKKQSNQMASIKRLSELVGKIADKVEPVFPGDDSDDLGALFEVRLREAAACKELVGELEDLDEIEYAHEPAERGRRKN